MIQGSKRKKYNVDTNLEQEVINLAVSLNQSDQNLQSQSQIGPTEGQEYPNLSVISNMPSTSTSLQNVGSKRIVNIFDSQDDVDIDCPDESLQEIIKLEYFRYKKMEIKNAENLQVLDWWKIHKKNFPHLFKVCQKYIHIPATSVPSERMFSLAGNIITEKRSRLLPKNVNLLTFLHHNSKYIPHPSKLKVIIPVASECGSESKS